MDTTKQKSKKSRLSTTGKTSIKKHPVKDVKKSSEFKDFDDKRCYSVETWEYLNEDEDLTYEF